MKMTKLVVWFYFFSLLMMGASAFAEDSKVEIRKIEGRTEAVVSSSEKPKVRINVRWFAKPFVWVGDGIVEALRFASTTVGVITDKTVETTQTATGFLFSPIFKTIDYKQHSNASK